MKSAYFSSVLCIFFIDSVICHYQWACTAPDENGQRYIPSVRRSVYILSVTSANKLYVYRVPNLDADCYGPVTTIDYCYIYNTSAGSGPPMFNWIVLILNDTGGNQIVIHRMYTIQSRASSTKCRNYSIDLRLVVCCDKTNINDFDLPQNFTFGVTESAQGNTHEAKLLGYYYSWSQYRVSTVVLNKAGLNLSVGSSINMPSDSVHQQRGVRMLWFVIGVASTESPTVTPLIVNSPKSIATNAATDYMSTAMTGASFTKGPPHASTAIPPITKNSSMSTNAPSDSSSTTKIFNDSSVSSTTITTIDSGSTQTTTMSVSIASNQGAVTGGAAGLLTLLLLALIIVPLLVLVWMTVKYKRHANEAQHNLDHQQPQKSEQREAAQCVQQEEEEAMDSEMKSNDTYISMQHNIPIEDTAACGQATPQIPMADNVVYGQLESNRNLFSDYDYISDNYYMI